jgi:Cell shape-determining protein
MQIDSGLIVDSASFIFRPAKVINSSVKKSKNSLTINKGLKDGIQPRMGVLSDDGVVGIVRNASKNFSVVIPLINIQSSISCKVKGKGYFGSLKWQGLDIRDFELKDIPKYAKLERGDTLITSGFSYIFPEGYKVGVVDTFWTIPGNDFYRTKVTVFTDFSKLDTFMP